MHDAGGNVMQPPVDAKQHGQRSCAQASPVHCVPSPLNVPPAAPQSVALNSWHVPFGRQQAPGMAQFTGVHVTRNNH
jgi:hypothetical protein